MTAGPQGPGRHPFVPAPSVKKKYDSGASIRALAEETGRSYGFVHRMLSESGVTLRGRGGATRGKKAASA